MEDEKELIALVRGRLVEDGHVVRAAASAETALGLLKGFKPDLILLDIVLPGMDGFEFLEKVRRTSRVPVVLLTGRRSEADRIRGLTAGADDYVVKPFYLSELSARVDRLLARPVRG